MNAEVGKFKLGLCSFGSIILWISLWSPSDLLYRLNCHVDKQPVVGDLFYTGLWIAGNSCRDNKACNPRCTTSISRGYCFKLALHVSAFNFQQSWRKCTQLHVSHGMAHAHTHIHIRAQQLLYAFRVGSPTEA